MVFVAIESAEPPVGPVNQWASHLTDSLTGPVFETMGQRSTTTNQSENSNQSFSKGSMYQH
jgi:hypothetical protein